MKKVITYEILFIIILAFLIRINCEMNNIKKENITIQKLKDSNLVTESDIPE